MPHFITATDTGAGKTYITSLLLEDLRRKAVRAVGFKPFCCGDRDDAVRLLAAGMPGFTLDQINPVWLKMPASPLAASWMENRTLDLGAVESAFAFLQSRADVVLVEGVGGWEAPITAECMVGDLASQLLPPASAQPVWVVVNNKLGALNHTLLTVHGIERRGLRCGGLILNQVSDVRDPASISHRLVLERVLPHVPVVAEVMHGETVLDSDFLH